MTGSLPDQPRLSIVLPTLGNYPVLRRVLDGLDRQDAPSGSFEVLVVADRADPEPHSVDAAIGRRAYPVTRLTGNLPGASANRNTGWHAARAPLVLFTDNDTIPVPRLVSEHLAWHERFPEEEVVVLGLVRWARGLKVTPFMKWLDQGIQFDFSSISGDEASWAHVYSANSSVKRSFLDRVGGYDEQRLPYLYEDLDWGYRAREHGIRVLFNRRAVVDHWRPMDLSYYQARAPRLAIAEWRFCQLHPEFPPWFYEKFTTAREAPPQSRTGAALARFVPRRTPRLGWLVWNRADLYWRQQIAPHFLAAWEELAAGGEAPPQAAASPSVERAPSG